MDEIEEIEDPLPQSGLVGNPAPTARRAPPDDVQELPWRDVVVDSAAQPARDVVVHSPRDRAARPPPPGGFLRRQAAKIVWLLLAVGVAALMLDALEPWKGSCEAQGGVLVISGQGSAHCVDSAMRK